MIIFGRDCVQGIDVSRWQGGINYAAFDLDFAYIKASGGDGSNMYKDPKFEDNSKWPTDWGAYHFASPCRFNPEQEAQFFCGTIRNHSWTLPPALDWEENVNPDLAINWVLRFMAEVEKQLGVRPIIYTGAYVPLTRSPELLKYDLWYANYTSHPAPCPPWGYNWSLWQFTSSGHAGGVLGGIDSDYATVEWFNRVRGVRPTPTPPPVVIPPVPPGTPTPTIPLEDDMSFLFMREHSEPAVFAVYSDGHRTHVTNLPVYKYIAAANKVTISAPPAGVTTETDPATNTVIWICDDGALADYPLV